MKKAIMETWKNFLKEDDWSLSSVGDDEHFGEPEDEQLAALEGLQNAITNCMDAGIPKEDVVATIMIWADNN